MNLSDELLQLHEDSSLSRELRMIKQSIKSDTNTFAQLLSYKSNLELWIIKNPKNIKIVSKTLNSITLLLAKQK